MDINELLDAIKVGLIGCIDGGIRKLETTVSDDKRVLTYWVGGVLRIDIKGLERSSKPKRHLQIKGGQDGMAR